jgi:hypothetical protein
VVPSLPGPGQHEKIAEEGSAGGHTYKHLAEVDENRCLEDGVGREVLKLKPELLQQQEEGQIGSANPQEIYEVNNTNSPAVRLPRGIALARILPASPGVLHPSRPRTRLSSSSA